MLISSLVMISGYRIDRINRAQAREDHQRPFVMSSRMRDICATAIALLEQSDKPLRATVLRDASGYDKPSRWGSGPFLDALAWYDVRVYDSRPGYVGLNDRHDQEDKLTATINATINPRLDTVLDRIVQIKRRVPDADRVKLCDDVAAAKARGISALENVVAWWERRVEVVQ